MDEWFQRYTDEIEAKERDIDPVLSAAIRRFIMRRHAAMLDRAIPGEKEYKGAWREKELWELRQMLAEEVDDELVYTAMFEWRRDIDGAQG